MAGIIPSAKHFRLAEGIFLDKFLEAHDMARSSIIWPMGNSILRFPFRNYPWWQLVIYNTWVDYSLP